jgi:hypothetical protein
MVSNYLVCLSQIELIVRDLVVLPPDVRHPPVFDFHLAGGLSSP